MSKILSLMDLNHLIVGGWWKRFVGFGRFRSNQYHRHGINPKCSSPLLYSPKSSRSSSSSIAFYYLCQNDLHLRWRFLCFRFLSTSSSGENGGCQFDLPDSCLEKLNNNVPQPYLKGFDAMPNLLEQITRKKESVSFEILIVQACRISKMVDLAVDIMDKMLSDGVSPRLTTHAVIIKSFFQSSRFVDAHRYVVVMSIRDRHSANMNYSLLVRLFWKSRRFVEAGQIMKEMMDNGLKPNFTDYVKILKALRPSMFSLNLKHKFDKFPSPPPLSPPQASSRYGNI